MAQKTFSLPRETNLVLARSIFARSVRKARETCRTHRANPNAGTTAARADRVLACIAQSKRVAFVRAANRTDIHGAAKTATVRKSARIYRDAWLRWKAGYVVSSGW